MSDNQLEAFTNQILAVNNACASQAQANAVLERALQGGEKALTALEEERDKLYQVVAERLNLPPEWSDFRRASAVSEVVYKLQSEEEAA
jgi:hypothetical protein